MITNTQIAKIALGEGIVYLDYGLATEILVGPTRGGGSLEVSETVRDIEFDGSKGKTKGMQVVDDQNAVLKVTVINASQDYIAMSLPTATNVGGVVAGGEIGLIPDTKYFTNATMFTKTADGQYKKAVIKNPMQEKGFSISAKPKGEGELAFEFQAHHDHDSDATKLYSFTDAASIAVTPVVKTTLAADLLTFIGLNPELYTSASYAPAYVVYLASKAVNDSPDSNQALVNTAVANLAAATLTLDTI